MENVSLNVVDFRTKCLSLRLSCFSSLCNYFGDPTEHSLPHYFMGTRLTRLDECFYFRSNLFPAFFLATWEIEP